MSEDDKPLIWLEGEVKTPPFSAGARVEAGFLLRRLQQGELLSLPHSRPMPKIAAKCFELRVRDRDHSWRIIYRIDDDAIVIAEVFSKKVGRTPRTVVNRCRDRLRAYDEAAGEDREA
ncbi:MAG: type II toxin-antitoxin system RelE/ParE family toxin [bacterium]